MGASHSRGHDPDRSRAALQLSGISPFRHHGIAALVIAEGGAIGPDGGPARSAPMTFLFAWRQYGRQELLRHFFRVRNAPEQVPLAEPAGHGPRRSGRRRHHPGPVRSRPSIARGHRRLHAALRRSNAPGRRDSAGRPRPDGPHLSQAWPAPGAPWRFGAARGACHLRRPHRGAAMPTGRRHEGSVSPTAEATRTAERSGRCRGRT